MPKTRVKTGLDEHELGVLRIEAAKRQTTVSQLIRQIVTAWVRERRGK